jgi:hypothetical protein
MVNFGTVPNAIEYKENISQEQSVMRILSYN